MSSDFCERVVGTMVLISGKCQKQSGFKKTKHIYMYMVHVLHNFQCLSSLNT